MIPSRLDLDLYKLTMMQFVWKYHRNERVKYRFKNRTTGVHLADYVKPYDVIRYAYDIPKFTEEEIEYLHSVGIFQKDFLVHLKDCPLANLSVTSDKESSQLCIEVEGNWHESILWETFILSIVNELYNQAKTESSGYRKYFAFGEGFGQLAPKIDTLQQRSIPIVDFGTRRRYSHEWQGLALVTLQKRIPHLLAGTSNVYMAKELHLPVVGTYAHEMEMGYSGLYPTDTYEQCAWLHRAFMRDWWEMYGEKGSIALPDTFGTRFFWNETPTYMLQQWRGLRQDSGNPRKFAVTAMNQYRNRDIDPREKDIVFSDGLDIAAIEDLWYFYKKEFRNVSFGWGTDLMNDCGNKPLSIVMKLVEINGVPVVKLSDNVQKASGDSNEVERMYQLLNSGFTEDKECRV